MAKLPSAGDIVRQTPNPSSIPLQDTRTRAVDLTPMSEAADRVGRAISGAGQQVYNVQREQELQDARDREHLKQERDRMDNLRVEEAFNTLRDKQLDLTLGDNGYANLKGAQVVNAKTPILDQYPKMFDDAVTEVSSGLQTDAQREKFKMRADAAKVSFKSDLIRHAIGETDKFNDEVHAGTLATEERAAAANWFSPDALDKSKARIQAVTEDSYSDKPQEYKDAKLAESYQRINSAVVSQAIAAGKSDYAQQYMKANIDKMNVSDVIRYSSDISKAKEEAQIGAAVDSTMADLPQRINPNDSDRLTALVAKAESGNRDYNSRGEVVTSSAGARGRMQVLDSTAKNPGYGVVPAKDDSLEERARVGRDYLTAMIKNYDGDVTKALAAYNAGPDTVDNAMKSAKKDPTKNWAEFLPDETKKYVGKITSEYAAGDNPVEQPTILDIKKRVADKLQGAPRAVIEKAQAKAEAAYGDVKAAASQKSDSVLEDIQARVDSGEIKSYNDLTPTELTTLGGKRVSARTYIDAAGKREENLLELSPAATTQYYAMYTDPIALKNTSISDIMSMAGDLGHQRVNALLQKRAEYVNRPEAEKAATVDSDQFKSVAIKFGYDLKSDKAKKELILIKDRTEQAITDMQNQEKRTLTRDEKDKVIKRMMVEFPEVKAQYKGGFLSGKATTMSARGYQIENPQNIIVPDNIKQQIIASYATAGRSDLTDAEVRDVYAEYLMRNKGVK